MNHKILSDMKFVPVEGHFHMTVTNRETGELVDEYEETNVVVLDAKQSMVYAIAGNSQGFMNTIKVGDDVGAGTLDAPEAPTETFDETSMSIIYTYPSALFVGYPSAGSVSFTALISGVDVMSYYPAQTHVVITSAALHTANGKVFAYKRFPQRSISDVLDISIVWTISYP